nr:hypothetical protein [Aurantimonas sp. MSK8Z-1]
MPIFMRSLFLFWSAAAASAQRTCVGSPAPSVRQRVVTDPPSTRRLAPVMNDAFSEGEKHDGCGDVLRRARPTEPDVGAEGAEEVRRQPVGRNGLGAVLLGQHVTKDRRVDIGRRHDVHEDAPVGIGLGEPLRQDVQRALGGTVLDRDRIRLHAAFGRDVDDPSPAPLGHAGSQRPGDPHGGQDVEVEGRLPVVVGHLLEGSEQAARRGSQAAGVVDGDVDRPQCPFGRANGGRQAVGVRHVADGGERALAETVDDARQPALVAREERDLDPLAVKRAGNPLADALARSRDQRDPACEMGVHDAFLEMLDATRACAVSRREMGPRNAARQRVQTSGFRSRKSVMRWSG